MKRRQQDSNLRTVARLRASNALPCRLGHASGEKARVPAWSRRGRAARHGRSGAQAEGEGVEPPRACAPPVFETGYRADGSPSETGCSVC